MSAADLSLIRPSAGRSMPVVGSGTGAGKAARRTAATLRAVKMNFGTKRRRETFMGGVEGWQGFRSRDFQAESPNDSRSALDCAAPGRAPTADGGTRPDDDSGFSLRESPGSEENMGESHCGQGRQPREALEPQAQAVDDAIYLREPPKHPRCS